ncbi:Nif3-like dinuclear metal center hexameric protein [Cardiobacterium valvarum]|uniref:Dinuclear metal center protein, YbgI family n=1 Tax=Cardiobacterium valvarum F0432 TaxID=797473 RepID=G9ZBP2_9GAMM|nr:Nif3-like dinuclear metal center hexameric protein [Cardiobacterium valvarum]EHM56031.1 dinuclear metal center protein, YbgI family [Cardiobacterium valvarum F0432]
MHRDELQTYLDDYLQSARYRDYAPNGVQIEGKAEIRRITTAVTASQAAIEAAIAQQADALLVHHGYFWKGEAPAITGIKKQRIAALLAHNINLIAYHLPLDQHAELGNNALFARHFDGETVWQSAAEPLIWHARIRPTTLSALLDRLAHDLDRLPLAVGENTGELTHIAWCTGAAQDYLQQAAAEGAQAYISGEYAEHSYHEARESDCTYISCGHHASERAGIRALGEHLATTFGLDVAYYDEPNPF